MAGSSRKPGSAGTATDNPGVARATTPTRRDAVLTALGANIAVAVAKAVAAAVTGSSALLAEALHSVADSVNEVLLLVGARRASRPADVVHPFGHARYRYLYAFVVSLAVFWVGGVLSVFEGIDHLVSGAKLGDPRWAIGVLVFAALLDGWSLRTTQSAWRRTKGALTWKRLIRETKAADLVVVFLEDVGAITGVAIAATGIGLTLLTANPAWDAFASIAIGVLLMAIGLVVNRETQSLLVGESAAPDIVASIRAAIAGTDGIDGVRELRSIHIGPDDLIVAAVVLVDGARTAMAISQSIREARRRVEAVSPFQTVVTIEPQVAAADSPPPAPTRSAAEISPD
jgi:cation diffusion facilitator family transporter